MSIQSEKLELIRWLAELQDSSILERIKWLKNGKNEANDWWSDLMEEEKHSIERGIADADDGKTSDHKTVRKTYEKWL